MYWKMKYCSVPSPGSLPRSHSIAEKSPQILFRLQPQASPFPGPEQHSSLGKSSEEVKIQFHFLVVLSVCALPLSQAEHLGLAQRSHPHSDQEAQS